MLAQRICTGSGFRRRLWVPLRPARCRRHGRQGARVPTEWPHDATRASWVRAIAAGIVVGAASGAALVQFDVDDDSAAIGPALLVTMGLIVALQLISRPRQHAGRPSGLGGSLRIARWTSVVLRIAARSTGPNHGISSDNQAAPSSTRLAIRRESHHRCSTNRVACWRGDLHSAATRRSGPIRCGLVVPVQRLGPRLSYRDRS
jgi:hypothetical protein